MKKGKPKYLEPAEYFPISIRKKYKLGEFAEKDDSKADEKTSKEKKKEV
jgi:hypothetical protein